MERAVSTNAPRDVLDRIARKRDSLDALIVANALGGNLSAQNHIGALVADFAGLAGIESYRIEAADASGGARLKQHLTHRYSTACSRTSRVPLLERHQASASYSSDRGACTPMTAARPNANW